MGIDSCDRDMIKVENLKKAFGPKLAVNGISFTVERGEILGFLGPNGSGKSTTMRMITGFMPPTEGKATVGGYDVSRYPIHCKRRIGYLPENAPAYPDMTVESFIEFSARIRGLHGGRKRKAIEHVLELCFLKPVRHQSIDTLSKGYLHRTCFAQSIVHDPDILILDEPTDGLDPNQKHEVRSIIKRMGERKAIIFSTHILEEVEAVCSRAIIIDAGRIVADGTPGELKLKAPDACSVLVRLHNVDKDEARALIAGLAPVDRVLVLEEGEILTLKVHPTGTENMLAPEIHDRIRQKGWRLIELRTEEGRLDEVFRSITRSDTEAKQAA